MGCFPTAHKIVRLQPIFKKKDMRKEIVTPPPPHLSLLSYSSGIVELTGNNNLVNYLREKYV
jgi:hypothetical protein